MEKEDLVYLCTMVGNLSGIPVRLYEGEQMTFFHSLVTLPKDPIALAQKETLSITDHVGFYVTPRFFYYGVVVSGNIRLVVGPSRQTAAQDQELKDMAFELDVRPDDVPEFLAAMKQIIRLPLESMMQMMCAINFMVNGEKLNLNDVVSGIEKPFALEETQAEQRMAEMENASEALHNSLAVEQTLMNIIRKGDVAALEAFVQDAPAVRPGVMAREQLRQAKNTFIVATAEACRAAIRGGMDVEDALTSSDAYIQQCEMMTDIHRITRLHYDMALYYTRQVERVRLGHDTSDLVRAVANYVQRHLSEAITTDQIAEHCFLSRQHLSRRFTQEAGVPLAAFVRNEKIEEAKRLLRYTEKTVSAIGLYLGFSSQGHFARVFKEIVGITPGEYREKNRE
ncbi:MAG: helix-turn-helix domain-containing protein [Clostridia bacterium]|nr:helix-turn-helix domain-containing protein [Clostridia bacterium]